MLQQNEDFPMLTVLKRWRDISTFNLPCGLEWRIPRECRSAGVERSFAAHGGLIYRRIFDREERDLEYSWRELTDQELALGADELLADKAPA